MICERLTKTRISQLGKDLPDRVFIANVWVRITTTPCHLGGKRFWFLCPSCGRRCAILYPRRCRKCVNARYAKESMSPLHRKLYAAFDVRERLGQTKDGVIPPFPMKPKWMRWHTYLRLRAKGLALEEAYWAAERLR